MTLRPPPGDESNAVLAEIVFDEIEAKGPITFARFMDIVVRHPRYGYYAASQERVGPTGDFLTAPETHPLFGWLVADQLVDFWDRLRAPKQFQVVEDGAGRGSLARQIVHRLAVEPPFGLEMLTYDLNDVNPQHARRIVLAANDDSLLIEPEAALGGAAPITGAIIANELLDAFSAHRLVLKNGVLRELYVGIVDGWFADIPGDLSPAALAALPEGMNLVEGQIVEIAPEIGDWMRHASDRLERGFIILVDYGYERPAIHDWDRFPTGTLKTYRNHVVGDDPFVHLGAQDITTHVDFSAVIEASKHSGLKLEGLTTLSEFVVGLGMDHYLMEMQQVGSGEEYGSARAAAFALLDPSGLGRFKVGIFSKGVAVDGPLRGLSFSTNELRR